MTQTQTRIAPPTTNPASTAHPTDSERFFFDTHGYLVVENFFSPTRVAALVAACHRAITRRSGPGYKREHPTSWPEVFGPNSRLFHILDEDPLFLDLIDDPAILAYVHGLFSPTPHFHASDLIHETQRGPQHGVAWHVDGFGDGYRTLGPGAVPFLQLKVGYILSDMTEPNQGNLTLVPGSHRSPVKPDPSDLKNPALFPGAIQVCGKPGTMFLFHNAMWHTGGPWTHPRGQRTILYYAYEHPWMMASAEPWRYTQDFLNSLSPERRKLFHGFLFEPKEYRWV